MAAPGETAVQPVQVESGVAVFPLLTSMMSELPAGVVAFQLTLPHVTERPASKIDETKVPDGTLALVRTQSTRSGVLDFPLESEITVRSTAFAGMAAGTVALIAPSMENWKPDPEGCTA